MSIGGIWAFVTSVILLALTSPTAFSPCGSEILEDITHSILVLEIIEISASASVWVDVLVSDSKLLLVPTWSILL